VTRVLPAGLDDRTTDRTTDGARPTDAPIPAAYPAPRPLAPIGAPPRHAVRSIFAWELEKLTAQVRTRVAFAVCLLGPFAFVGAVKVSGTLPADTLFGRWMLVSGFAAPLVVLGFAAAWGFPLLTCVVAGDVFSAEDQLGTWKTILTRSTSRGAIFVGKISAVALYIVAMLVTLTGAGLAAGLLIVGSHPLVGLSGNSITAGTAAGLVLEAWATVLLPALAFGSIGVLLSIVSRNSLVGILGPFALGLAMQFLGLVDGLGLVRRSLLGTQFLAWHGLFAQPTFTGPIVEDVIVSAVYLALALGASWFVLRRRDFAGA
jgi:ABC-2 type transport system permease protein